MADLFDTKRKLWKERHDITIHGIPVEVYVEDQAHPVTGSVYSLLSNEWLKKPKQISAHWDNSAISRETLIWLEYINRALASKNLARLETVKDELKAYRQQGLNTSGEFGPENLAYKNLRNLGAISLLMAAAVKLKDRQLSI